MTKEVGTILNHRQGCSKVQDSLQEENKEPRNFISNDDDDNNDNDDDNDDNDGDDGDDDNDNRIQHRREAHVLHRSMPPLSMARQLRAGL